jgi:6-pyruvoyltetrahydropterin/6-carboxytetrahydropterin synthase
MGDQSVEISKEVLFEAAHYLHNPRWDRRKNLEIFGRCSGFRADNPQALEYPHGHSYRLRVTVRGPVDPATGFVIDFKRLKDLLAREVLARYDHRFLNKEVEPFRSNPRLQPTAENIVQDLWKRLSPALRREGVVPVVMVLWESETSFVTYRGGGRR